ncbi:hypothetical protein ACRRTK_021237 [Alexandromys fortis]
MPNTYICCICYVVYLLMVDLQSTVLLRLGKASVLSSEHVQWTWLCVHAPGVS